MCGKTYGDTQPDECFDLIVGFALAIHMTLTDSVKACLNDDTTLPLRNVPGSTNLKWSMRFAYDDDYSNFDIFLKLVGGNAKVKATLSRSNYARSTNTAERDFFDGVEQKISQYHADYRDYSVTCTVEITPLETVLLETISMFEFIDNTKSNCWDVKLVVEKAEIKVHRGFLSMISPVFHAMFEHKSKESQTGIIEISDFTEATVQSCLDYCYGKKFNKPDTKQIIDMVKFFNKYDISSATIKLDRWLTNSLSVKNFAPIAEYAWLFSREDLKDSCGKLFFEHVKELAFDPDVIALGSEVYAELGKAGAKNVTLKS